MKIIENRQMLQIARGDCLAGCKASQESVFVEKQWNYWKSIKIEGTQRKTMNIIENQWKSLEIIENVPNRFRKQFGRLQSVPGA